MARKKVKPDASATGAEWNAVYEGKLSGTGLVSASAPTAKALLDNRADSIKAQQG